LRKEIFYIEEAAPAILTCFTTPRVSQPYSVPQWLRSNKTVRKLFIFSLPALRYN